MTDPAIDGVIERARETLATRWPRAEVTGARRLPGGHSGITYVIELDHAGPHDRAVLKLTPPGREPVGRHDVRRQARAMEVLGRTSSVPVPEVLANRSDPSPLAVVSWVDGDTTEPVLDEVTLSSASVTERARGAACLLASLHQVDTAELRAGEVTRTPLDELDRWRPTMGAVDPELRPGAEQLEAALRARAPGPADRVGLVHGDFRLGNILCVSSEIRALIDWEIWSLGDPRVDLGWFLVFCDPNDLPSVGHDAAGMPTADELRAVYAEHGGDVRDATWFDALGRYKMAAIMAHNLTRHRRGSHHDPFQEQLPETIVALIERGRGLLQDT